GNVRELINIIERLAILGTDPVDAGAVRGVLPANRRQPVMPPAADTLPALPEAMDDFERGLIARALTTAEGNVAGAARLLQTDRANLYRRMRRLGLDR
ncbi:MAG: helix-turn-helix domain-containing protein, partial [Gemmatimonadales bacterium]